jgi:hypothetical protein
MAAGWESADTSRSVFAVPALSINMYTLPLDVFGGARAAFAVSLLAASYGAVQAVISPAFGKRNNLYVCARVAGFMALVPRAGRGILRIERAAL